MIFASTLRFALIVLILALPGPSPSPAQTPTSASQIPSLTADTLAGEHVQLPADLQGKAGILVLGFGKGARPQVRDWGKRLATDYATSPTVLYYEIALIADVPRFLRGIVLKEIASDVSDRGKHHFIPVTENEARWRALAQAKDNDLAYILVVNASGGVQWTTSGALTDVAYTAVRDHLPASQK